MMMTWINSATIASLAKSNIFHWTFLNVHTHYLHVLEIPTVPPFPTLAPKFPCVVIILQNQKTWRCQSSFFSTTTM
ncbi:hypothetical protein VTI28DRAFT_10427 [Corynascus sepedonium]